MIKSLKKKYIDKLDIETKQAIAFINNLDEKNLKELEKLSLRKLIYTKLKIEKISTYSMIREFIAWENYYKTSSEYNYWIKSGTGNDIGIWLESMYRWVKKAEYNSDLKPYINPEKRREDLEEYFHLEPGLFHSKVLVYEGEEGHLYTIILYDDPKWAAYEHVIMRGIDSIEKEEELKQGASVYGQSEWLKYNIEQNPEDIQKMMKEYKYTTMIYIYYTYSCNIQFFTGTCNENLTVD